jgi:hypothetical protein
MDKNKIIKFLWISMWATLILMVVLKLTFNYYYPIVIENSKLLEISKYIDEHKLLDASISYVFYIINAIFISLCCLQEKWFKNKRDFIIILTTYTLAYPIKITYLYLGSLVILIPYIIIPLFLTRKPKRWVFIMFGLDVIFQILSNFARGNNIIINDTCIVKKAMLLDYYLMFIIYYIGGCHMGWDTVLPFFTKKETVINAKIEKLQKKIKKLEAKKLCLKKL